MLTNYRLSGRIFPDRAAEIAGVGVGALDLDAHIPHRRVVDLARYGMSARAQALRRHGTERRLATLIATIAYLEARSIDDCLGLLDLLIMTELLGKAGRGVRAGPVTVPEVRPR